MKNTLIPILLGILIILSGVAIAYKAEIKEFSDNANALQEYIMEKIKSLSSQKQEDFNNFKELKIEDKLLRALELNKDQESDKEIIS